MYNRYIPQSDGSFRKNKLPEGDRSTNRQQSKNPQNRNQQSSTPPPAPQPVQERRAVHSHRTQSAESFLKQLLPQGLDTGDLLIAVLLLLMAGDCQEDKNTALLTLALYLFL